MSAALPRPQGDPLTGLTMDELMGQGPFHRIEAQVALGQEKLREAMAVARRAMGKIRAPGGTPHIYGNQTRKKSGLTSWVVKWWITGQLCNGEACIRASLILDPELIKSSSPFGFRDDDPNRNWGLLGITQFLCNTFPLRKKSRERRHWVLLEF
ncbi:hypothetical protein DUI87_19750 [Hirundo rustica rustica]|uniref:Uncharacterized protein n=1 Tax=Hirundo rustica rustica TaxID=333673 RepID=A0A3M0JS86_HIRRU|nr:hypothetical protein DUI87_19750 [Hirundo rustica rustica]